MKELIEQYLNEYIAEKNLTLTNEQYQRAYKGVEFWLSTALPDAVSDSVANVL